MELILQTIKSLVRKLENWTVRAQATADDAKATASNAQRTADQAQKTADKKLDAKNPVVSGNLSMNGCKAGGDKSAALGVETIATFDGEHVTGRYNVRQPKYQEERIDGRGKFSGNSFYVSSSYEADLDTGRLRLIDPVLVSTTEDVSSFVEWGMYFTRWPEWQDSLYVYENHSWYSGSNTIASFDYSARIMIAEAAGYAVEVGNGSADDARSNAHTLDWDGNAWFAGDIYVGGNGQDDENAKKLATLEDLEAGGSIPHIGDNGNWWIGDEDTGVSAKVANSPLTFSGAVSATYDGSESVYVNIPKGGNASVWNYERTQTTNVEAFTVHFPASLGKFAMLNIHISIPCADLTAGTNLYADLGGGRKYGFGDIPVYADTGTSGINLYLMRWNDNVAFMSASLSEFTQNAKPGACTANLEHNNATSLRFTAGGRMLPPGIKVEAWGMYTV